MVITRGNKEEHEKKLFDVWRKLDKTGYRASERKSEIFQNKMKWMGRRIDDNGTMKKEKTILELKQPEN